MADETEQAALIPMSADLSASYEHCRELNRSYGRSYYLATRALPVWKRKHVYALYGFARYADEIVDRTQEYPVLERERRLRDWSDRFLAGLHGERIEDPLLPAVLHTIAVFQLDRADFATFLHSMAMDLTIAEYADYPALVTYMEGSAAAIGTMMLPILQPRSPALAREPARQLGFAFQITNFIRDVGEDLGRGRIYLPQDDLARFEVSPADLYESAAARSATPKIKELISYEVKRARTHYAAAAPGLDLLPGRSGACMRVAFHLYRAILDQVERADNDVFVRRAVVPNRRRLQLVAESVFAPRLLPSTN